MECFLGREVNGNTIANPPEERSVLHGVPRYRIPCAPNPDKFNGRPGSFGDAAQEHVGLEKVWRKQTAKAAAK